MRERRGLGQEQLRRDDEPDTFERIAHRTLAERMVQHGIDAEKPERTKLAVERGRDHRARIEPAVARQHPERLGSARVGLLAGDVPEDGDAAGVQGVHQAGGVATGLHVDAVPNKRDPLRPLEQRCQPTRMRDVRRRNRRATRMRADRHVVRAAMRDRLTDAQVKHRRRLRRGAPERDDQLRVFEIGIRSAAHAGRRLALTPGAPIEVLHTETAHRAFEQHDLFIEQPAAPDRADCTRACGRDGFAQTVRPEPDRIVPTDLDELAAAAQERACDPARIVIEADVVASPIAKPAVGSRIVVRFRHRAQDRSVTLVHVHPAADAALRATCRGPHVVPRPRLEPIGL